MALKVQVAAPATRVKVLVPPAQVTPLMVNFTVPVGVGEPGLGGVGVTVAVTPRGPPALEGGTRESVTLVRASTLKLWVTWIAGL